MARIWIKVESMPGKFHQIFMPHEFIHWLVNFIMVQHCDY